MSKVPAKHFVETLVANVDNEKLSDAEFREFVRNTLPIVEGAEKYVSHTESSVSRHDGDIDGHKTSQGGSNESSTEEKAVCFLRCSGERKDGEQCSRVIKGYRAGLGGMYFVHSKLGTCDLRNKEWRCWQHGRVGMKVPCAFQWNECTDEASKSCHWCSLHDMKAPYWVYGKLSDSCPFLGVPLDADEVGEFEESGWKWKVKNE